MVERRNGAADRFRVNPRGRQQAETFAKISIGVNVIELFVGVSLAFSRRRRVV